MGYFLVKFHATNHDSVQFCMTIEPAREIMVFIIQATSEGSGEPAHSHSLASAFAVHTHEVWKWTKGQTKNQPHWMAVHACLKNEFTRTKSAILSFKMHWRCKL